VLLTGEEHPEADVIRAEENWGEILIFLPVVREDDLLGSMYETWLSISWRVEDLARILVGRAHDDETGRGMMDLGDTFGFEVKSGAYMLNTLTALKSPAYH